MRLQNRTFRGPGPAARAIPEQNTAQSQEYGWCVLWARHCCGLSVPEFESLLLVAASTQASHRGTAGLPMAPQQLRPSGHSRSSEGPSSRLTARAHAVLLCRAAGLRKAVASGEVGCLGGLAEMERLLGLDDQEIQAECAGTPQHLRKAGSFDVCKSPHLPPECVPWWGSSESG